MQLGRSDAPVPVAKVSPTDLKSAVLAWLEPQVTAKRLRHILAVEALAIALARQHQVDPQQAAEAALLHDLAKHFPPAQLLAMAQEAGVPLDDTLVAAPQLLHAEVGAIVAKDIFGITDPAVLDAIRHHTLGAPQMSPLSCVVFLADSLEPGRGNTPELASLRDLSQRNLYLAIAETSTYVIQRLLMTRRLIHPRTVLTRNWALQQVSRRGENDSHCNLG